MKYYYVIEVIFKFLKRINTDLKSLGKYKRTSGDFYISNNISYNINGYNH